MGAFGAAVRGGMQKVAAGHARPIIDPLALSDADFFQALHDPEHAFVRQMQRDPDPVRAYLNQQAAEREAIMQESSGRLSGFRGRKAHELAAGDRGVMSAEAARHRAAAGDLARINLMRNRLGVDTYKTPEYRKGGITGDLSMALDRASFEQQLARNLRNARGMHGGNDISKMLSEYGVGVGPASSVQADPRRAQLASQMARGAELAGVAAPAKGGAGAGGPSFFSKYKGPLLGAAGVLGGGMLLSHLMRKKDDRVQGPYGPVYR